MSINEKCEESDKLSDQVAEYYRRHGKHRDLGRYLRTQSNFSNDDSIEKDMNLSQTEKRTSSSTNISVDKNSKISSKVNSKEVSKQDDTQYQTRNAQDSFLKTLSETGMDPKPDTTHVDYKSMGQPSKDEFQQIKPTDTSHSKSMSPEVNKSTKKLEWDSLADVGYETPVMLTKQNCESMSSLEKSILHNIFEGQGIEISFNTTKSLPDIQKIFSEKDGSSNRSESKVKWRETLKAITKGNVTMEKNLTNIQPFNSSSVNIHSTPITQKCEQFCQTSYVKMESKEVQAITTTSDFSCNYEWFDFDTPSSFEYIPVTSKLSHDFSDKEKTSPKSPIRAKLKDNTCKKIQKGQHSSSDFDEGFNLLYSLIKSQNLKKSDKKMLARKIIQKIVKLSSPDSTNSSLNPFTSKKNHTNIDVKPSELHQRLSESSASRERNSKSDLSATLKRLSPSNKNEIINLRLDSLSKDNSWDNEKISMCIDEVSQNQSNYNTKTNIPSASSEIYKKKVLNSNWDANVIDDFPAKNSSCISGFEQKKSVENVIKIESYDAMNDWLNPLTQAEINYEKRKKNYKNGSLSNPKVSNDCSVRKYIEKEKRSHYEWIQNEINHLENLKFLLISQEKKENFPNNTRQGELKYHSSNSNTGLYDTVACNNYSSLTSADNFHMNIESDIGGIHSESKHIIKKNSNEKIQLQKKQIIDSRAIKSSANVNTTTFFIDKKSKNPKQNDKTSISRSKLETPKGCNIDIQSFARQKKQEFLAAYKRDKCQTYDDPAFSNHYSIPNNNKEKSNRMVSVTSSEFFVSSESISVPCTANTSATTTTHQYDSKIGIAIQTTDSLYKTQPIFGPRFHCCCNQKSYICNHCIVSPTIREYKPNLTNKQTQVKPQSVSYYLTFDEQNNIFQTTKLLTLQEYLEKQLPNFLHNANERQNILKKIHDLRTERNTIMRQFIANTSINSISMKLGQLPPPPTKSLRIFPTKQMKAITQKRYLALPEVIEKAEKVKTTKWKKSNKLLVDIFNKKLQRRVHKGKISLGNSRTVI